MEQSYTFFWVDVIHVNLNWTIMSRECGLFRIGMTLVVTVVCANVTLEVIPWFHVLSL